MYPNLAEFEVVRKAWDKTGKFISDRIFDASLPAQQMGWCSGPGKCTTVVTQCACTATIPKGKPCTWNLP